MHAGATVSIPGSFSLAAWRVFGPSWNRPHWRVIYFHGVEERWAARFAEYLERFSKTFSWVPFSRGLVQFQSGELNGPCMSLTFDDADRSVYENALPLLLERKIPACIFAVPRYLDAGHTVRDATPRPVMSWRELREWLSLGMEVGNHTYSHPNLRTLSNPALVEEVVKGREVLEDRLGVPVCDFAYPYGQFDTRTLATIATVPGIRSQVTTYRGRMLPGRKYSFIRRDRCDLYRTPQQTELIMRLADRLYPLRMVRNLLLRKH